MFQYVGEFKQFTKLSDSIPRSCLNGCMNVLVCMFKGSLKYDKRQSVSYTHLVGIDHEPYRSR